MKFKIRPWDLDDLTDLVRHAGNYNVAKNLRNRFPHPYSIADGEKFIRYQMEKDPTQHFAITANGHAIGSIGLMLMKDIHCKNAEIGYWIAESYWGKGVMSSMVPEIVGYGFENFDITRIFAVVSNRNIGSGKVLENSGFDLEARFKSTLFKNGSFHDELVYAIRRST